MMVVRKISLGPVEARELVKIASKCDFDIDISYNRYTVDAKSILGVQSPCSTQQGNQKEFI